MDKMHKVDSFLRESLRLSSFMTRSLDSDSLLGTLNVKS
jgi:hypothetical protein